jgi:integrase
LPWSEAPVFWRDLDERTDTPAQALKFLLLTATRRSEALGARWEEIDREQAVWTIPPGRMKANREHRVPLSTPTLAVLDTLASLRRNDFLFPGVNHGRPIAATATLNLMRSLRPETTVHGLRSTFRTWCAEATNTREDICEAALGHQIKDRVVLSYQRGDLLALRSGLMADWARYLTGSNTVED